MARPVRRAVRRHDEPYDSDVDAPDNYEQQGSAPRPGIVRHSSQVSRGWDAVKRLSHATRRTKYLKLGDGDSVTVKFLEKDPFATYHAHWIGGKTYTGPEEDCPLCDIGDPPRHYILFNVVDVATREVMIWRTGLRTANTLHSFSEKPRTNPINRDDLYWEIKRTGTGVSTNYLIYPVDPSVVEADGLSLIGKDEMERLNAEAYDASVVYYSSREELEDVADQLSSS